MTNLVLATRASALALWQAEHVRDRLQKLGHSVTLNKITTRGDQILDRSLSEIGGKGLFLKELEDALLSGEADFAVHSLKDVPYELPAGLCLVAILERAASDDVFISADGRKLNQLNPGEKIGTSSLRRLVQLSKHFPNLVFSPCRGNVDTRLKKLAAGEWAGIILAKAGLVRLGRSEVITESLNTVAAAGQGAIAIECREDRDDLKKILSVLNDPETECCVNAERRFLSAVQGSCQTPVGCHVRADGDGFFLRCFRSEPDGTRFFLSERNGAWDDLLSAIDESANAALLAS